LTHFICKTDFDDLPIEVVDNTKRWVLKAMGCALCGARRISGRLYCSLMDWVTLEVDLEPTQGGAVSCGVDTTVVVTVQDGKEVPHRVRAPKGPS